MLRASSGSSATGLGGKRVPPITVRNGPEVVREKLREVIGRYGLSICDEPRRCRGVLYDVCGEYTAELRLLAAALEEGVARELQSSHASLEWAAVVARLSTKLQENLYLNSSAANWAVESWAVALGLISKSDCRACTPEDNRDRHFGESKLDVLRLVARACLADGVTHGGQVSYLWQLGREWGIADADVEATLRQSTSGPGTQPLETSTSRSSGSFAVVVLIIACAVLAGYSLLVSLHPDRFLRVNERMAAEVAALRGENSQLSAQIVATTGKAADMATRADHFEALNAKLQQEVDGLKVDNGQLHQRISGYNEQVGQLERKVSSKDTYIRELGGRIDDLKARLAEPHVACSTGDDAPLGKGLNHYLHKNRLPYVSAQVITDSNCRRSVVFTGCVQTSKGQSDAVSRSEEFLGVSVVPINRIELRSTCSMY